MSNTPATFDFSSTPLHPGNLLIEASAGTGKTYSLVAIVLRLLVESPDLSIEQILILTFTENATSELTERVSAALNDLIKATAAQQPPDDPATRFLLESIAASPDPDAALQRLRHARANFDNAAIFTIHGFCNAVLAQNAFECKTPFASNAVSVATEQIERVALDAWRCLHFQDLPPALPLLLKQAGWQSHDQLIAAFSKASTARLHLTNQGLPPTIAATNAIAQLESHCARFQSALRADANGIIALLHAPNQLDKRSFSDDRRRALCDFIAFATDPQTTPTAVFCAADPQIIASLSQSKISRSLRKNASQPSVFDAFAVADSLQEAISTAVAGFTEACSAWAAAQIEALKQAENVMTFDDMIFRVRDALESSPTLRDTLRARFKVALVDEFQDTDSNQLAILRAIFDAPDHRLFCVGDPKQSIYQFRGADLATYLSVKDDPSFQRFALSTNFRSDPPLVHAVNHLFHQDAAPFGDGIDYAPIQPAAQSTATTGPRMCFTHVDPILSLEAATVSTANQILQAFPAFQLSDIAVLVYTNAQANSLATAFAAHSVPCIRKIDDSVFNTNAARSIFATLQAVLNPNRLALLRGALASPLFARSATVIDDLQEGSEAALAVIEAFVEARQRWRSLGIFAAADFLLSHFTLRDSLLRAPQGETFLGACLHVFELLHSHEQNTRCDPEALMAWLSECINSRSSPPPNDFLLRKSTDRDAIILSTIHRSKGLEYKAVIIPFASKPPSRNRTPDPLEEMRKLYVALTRAKHVCYAFVQPHKNAHLSPLGQLLRCEANLPITDAAETCAATANGTIAFFPEPPACNGFSLREPPVNPDALRCPTPPRIPSPTFSTSFSGLTATIHAQSQPRLAESPEDAKADFSRLEEHSDAAPPIIPKGAQSGLALHHLLEHIDFTDPTAHPEHIAEACRLFGLNNPLQQQWLTAQLPAWLNTPLTPEPNGTKIRHSSGSKSLSKSLSKQHQTRCSSASRPDLLTPSPRCSVDSDPDFVEDPNLSLILVPLTPEPTLRLSAIPNTRRLNELAFYFAIADGNPQSLASAVAAEPIPGLAERLASLTVPTAARFLNGFVDLTFAFAGRFFIIDWKSNYIGPNPEDYTPAAIHAVMLDALYHLQYLLYVTALDAYLSQRVPNYHYDSHFGEVFYVFLRGFGTRPGHAVFRHRPALQTILNLRQCLRINAPAQ